MENSTNNWSNSNLDLDFIRVQVDKIRNEVHKVIVGQDDLIDLMIASLFTGGHVLIEGVPGIAKTMTAKLLAQTLNLDFKRIQFTPDLMPADVTGTSIFNQKTGDFSFNKGPVFTNIVLIDEINRSPAKTQAALFEVMEERQITVDGKSYKMNLPFMVIATQNPIEQEGTYRLPEAQLDRFMFRILIEYPSLTVEKQILKLFRNDFSSKKADEVKGVMSASDILKCQDLIEKVFIKDELLDYIADIVYTTRNNPDLFLGASPRASLSIMKASKAIAAINGRDFVTPDDIRRVCEPVLNHRIILTPEREMEGMTGKEVIADLIKKVEVPR